jgi:hypothetical protein
LKLTKKELVELLMMTEFGQGLGKHALLNMHVTDLQEKATAFSVELERSDFNTTKGMAWQTKRNATSNLGERICG